MSAARFLFLAITLFACVHVVVGGDKAKYNVVGALTCGGYPYNGAFVAFFEYDPHNSDLCAAVKSNSSGYYHSSAIEDDGLWAGWPDELFFYVAHKCNTHKYKCVKRSLGENIWYSDLNSNAPPHVVDTIELSKEQGEKCDERMEAVVKNGRADEPEECYAN
ncbi:hypothetical protein M3Y94_00660400 [Aphelenchoides besseyi]|nr:hypothetical protein M3Y94_00660400 [Aphelenchoides besseyi]